jgi:hypothetical protein
MKTTTKEQILSQAEIPVTVEVFQAMRREIAREVLMNLVKAA